MPIVVLADDAVLPGGAGVLLPGPAEDVAAQLGDGVLVQVEHELALPGGCVPAQHGYVPLGTASLAVAEAVPDVHEPALHAEGVLLPVFFAPLAGAVALCH